MVNVIAGMFPNATERRSYQRAASDFRIPYWDWAVSAPEGEDHFPDVFWEPTMPQKGPKGVQTIRNPLYAYPFHPKNEDAFIWSPVRNISVPKRLDSSLTDLQLKSWDETKRAPNTDLSLTSPNSDNEQVNQALLSKLPEIQQRLFILFSSYKDYNAFSSKAWAASQDLSTWDSIEAVHDIVHIYGGLKGHMTYVPLSSFDPLFLLHHTMTDRLVAMWQTLNPTAWIEPMAAGETSFTTLKGTIQSSTTPLTPFVASDDGTFWNSDMSRTTEAFGYAYADVNSPFASGQDVQNELIRKITQWYGESSLVGLRARERKALRRPQKMKTARIGAHHFKSARPNVRPNAEDPPVSAIVQNGRYTEWIANVHVNVEALDGNYAIHFFLGQPPLHVEEWNSASNLVGTVAIFAMDRATGSQAKISGTAPLTSALIKMVAAGEIPHLRPSAVEIFLQETLHFRILGSNDEEVDPMTVAGLYVGISSATVTVPESEAELPQWGRMQTRLELWT